MSTLDVARRTSDERVVRVKNKAWFFGGAALGLAIPLGMRVYERVLMLGHVRPVALWLFWPTSLFMNFRQSYTVTSDVLLFSLMILCNALLYGLLASVLRRASIGVAALLLIVVWVFLPPSDSALVSRFGEHKDELQRLVQRWRTVTLKLFRSGRVWLRQLTVGNMGYLKPRVCFHKRDGLNIGDCSKPQV